LFGVLRHFHHQMCGGFFISPARQRNTMTTDGNRADVLRAPFSRKLTRPQRNRISSANGTMQSYQ
jgi:hypothetical protein